MAAIIVKLECITNMHVGNGDVNYNIIDNEVEKDPVTGYPTINSSGVKGALREFFDGDPDLKGHVDTLFGADEKGKTTPGQLKILGADMIARAVRASKGTEPYYLVTTQSALDKYEDNCAVFLGRKPQITVKNVTDRAAEGIDLTQAAVLDGKEVHIMAEDQFRSLELPVMARNKLDNGISRNLWYEQIVPHESLFALVVIGSEAHLGIFRDAVSGKVIQFGGNASIGYGLCKVSVTGA